ncbi:MAG: two-component system, OmpR family, sensor kinase [Solirubrobacteraceae bacterium]|nr:two-component system, OmpR family, sensor kinase [Solirubrobacteraceae bacterium]
MRPATLRARVVLAATVAIVVAVVLLALAVPALLERQLRGSLDSALQTRAADVARLAASTPDLLTEPGVLEGRLSGGSALVEVIDRRGRIVARSSDLGVRVLPDRTAQERALHARAVSYEDAELGSEPIRLYAAPLGELGGGAAAGGAVLVAGPTAPIADTVSRTRRLVLLAALAAAALGALLAAALTRRALGPLRRLSSGARAIERTGEPSARLPRPAADDEVGELAATLNAMLASLERAREAERRFVGDASHELRTPLTALRGNVSYLARHGADPAALADLEADAARMSALLDDLLALAREDAAAPVIGEPVDLAELARDAAAADENARASGPPALVSGERPALERAVGNLVRNARRHGPAGGRIEIVTSADGAHARIAVADEGTGLTPEQAAHAFERFWRAPGAPEEGSGLGLAIVRAIAERHGGRVTVDGARFEIELPALKELSRTARRTHGDPV